jgi:SPP1 gp7 family putative phage head morphogenesis protein
MISLTALIAREAARSAAGRRRRLRRPPRLLYPTLVEQAYLRDILRLLEPAKRLVEERLLPELSSILAGAGVRTDDDRDYAGRLERTFDGISLAYGQTVPLSAIRGAANTAVSDTSRFNRGQVGRQVKTVIGIDAMQSEPWLEPAARAFTRENVALIKSIPERYFGEIEKLVMSATRSGVRNEDLAKQIADRFSVSESRAALIARDQIGKWNGQLTRNRHQDVGLTRYRWRNSKDERVRGRPDGAYPNAKPSHWDREGKIYAYDKPPPGGHPGEAIQCRCYHEPVFEDLLGDEFAVDQTESPAASDYVQPRARVSAESFEPPARSEPTPENGAARLEIRAKPIEHAAIFGANGEQVFRGTGAKDSVTFPASTLRTVYERGDCVVTHNHPEGSPLSPQDVAFAVTNNTREVRAVRADGSAFVVTRPAGGWGNSHSPKQIVRSLSRAYSKALDQARARGMEARASGATNKETEAVVRRVLDDTVQAEFNRWSSAQGYNWRVRVDRR